MKCAKVDRVVWRVVVLTTVRKTWGAYLDAALAEKVASQLRRHGFDAIVEAPGDGEPRAA